MKQVTVLFFATIRDHMGTKKITLELPEEAAVGDLKKALAFTNPQAATILDSALVSINREYAFANETIPDGAEVALFPHVSGG
jgi:molybdopterin converting factor subunit 1